MPTRTLRGLAVEPLRRKLKLIVPLPSSRVPPVGRVESETTGSTALGSLRLIGSTAMLLASLISPWTWPGSLRRIR